MDFGICMAAHINDIDYVVRAEELGFTHAWIADSQMIWSDCYATLALAATRTSTIRLGTGVAISGTRPAPNNASGIATINALAPGRTFFGVGAGNTAMRIMGLPPHKIREFESYLQTLLPLLKGDEAMLRVDGREIPIRHVMPDDGFVNFDAEIPVYISGFGPRSLGLAGQYGHGAVMSLPASPGMMESMWAMIESGAQKAGRTINRDQFYTTALTTMVVLDEGESVDSDRVRAECGAFAMATLHYAYDQFRNFGHQPPGVLSEVWDDYVALMETYPEDRRHQRIHAGHNCWVVEEEEQFLTPTIMQSSCMIGTRDELLDRVRGLEAAGLNQIMLLPPFDPRFEVIERVASDIISEQPMSN
ncbi:MAG: LLM class flavin-dependent oxidoreductase [Pseudomonadales bacterium]|nr:LLM class flavin-dependent oxidoreductase [Pseudomonadales bacterium]